MKAIRLVLVATILLVSAAPALAAPQGKWGCFTCQVVYSTSQLYKEKCNQVLSGQYGTGIYCYTVTMDFATFCQMEGGACYYIVVDGAKAPSGQRDSRAALDAKSPAPIHIY